MKNRRLSAKLNIVLFLVVFVPPLALSICYFYFTISVTRTSLSGQLLLDVPGPDVNQVSQDVNYSLEVPLDRIKGAENSLGVLLNLPKGIFKYNYYVRNNLRVTNSFDELIDTTFRVKINDQYKQIRFGEKSATLVNLPIESLRVRNYEYSFIYSYSGRDSEQINEPFSGSLTENENNIDLYIKPTGLSVVMIFLFGIIFMYGLLLLASGIYKFVYFGRPFIE